MLGKLAVRNARRSMRDYSIYILTVTIIFSLLYAFNMIIFSEDILMLSSMMKSMSYAVIFVSVIIVFITGWLVHYMNNFMLQRRCKEFGTYMILGISNKAITKLFLLENAVIGGVSLAIGLIVGSFLYQIFTLIIMHIFEASYRIKVSFSLKALVLTLFYVLVIYAFSMMRTKRKLRKMKIYDLIYEEKKNETMMIKNKRGNVWIFVASVIVGTFGTILLYDTFFHLDESKFFNSLCIASLCIVASIYGFYMSLSSILIRLFVENKKIKYKKDNLFLFRNLSAKMNTMSITLGTLGLLFTLTLVAVSVGMLFKGLFDEQASAITAFDISVVNSKNNFEIYREYIKDNLTIEGEKVYPIYRTGSKVIYDLLKNTSIGGSYWEDDPVMKLSDYKELRKMLGYSDVDLEEGHFFLQCINGVKDAVETKKDLTLFINGKTFKYQKSYLENFSLYGVNGAFYVVVIPDSEAEKLEVEQWVYVVDTKEETTEEDYNKMYEYINSLERDDNTAPLWYLRVKGAILAQNRSTFTILSFSLFYGGLIFLCVAATILAVHQLSDAVKYRFRYGILSNLGMSKPRIDGLILKQFLVYFGFPILLPIPMNVFVAVSVYQIFNAYVSRLVLTASLFTSIGMFLFVYVLYFIASYIVGTGRAFLSQKPDNDKKTAIRDLYPYGSFNFKSCVNFIICIYCYSANSVRVNRLLFSAILSLEPST